MMKYKINADLAEKAQQAIPVEAMLASMFPTIIENTQDAYVMVDHNSLIVLWNKTAQTFFGYSKAEALGKTLTALIIPEEMRVQHNLGFAKYQKNGSGSVLDKTIEVEALRKSGDKFPIELSITPYENNGKRYAAACIRDISERKRTEEELNILHERLKDRFNEEANKASRAKAEVAAIFEKTTTPHVLLDKDLQIVAANTAFHQLHPVLDLDSDTPYKDLFKLFSNPQLSALIRHFINDKKPYKIVALALEPTDANQTLTFWDISLTPIELPDDNIQMLLSFADVTEHQRIQDTQRALLEIKNIAQSDKIYLKGVYA